MPSGSDVYSATTPRRVGRERIRRELETQPFEAVGQIDRGAVGPGPGHRRAVHEYPFERGRGPRRPRGGARAGESPQADVAAQPDDAIGFDVERLHADAAVEDRTHRAHAGFERLDATAGRPQGAARIVGDAQGVLWQVDAAQRRRAYGLERLVEHDEGVGLVVQHVQGAVDVAQVHFAGHERVRRHGGVVEPQAHDPVERRAEIRDAVGARDDGAHVARRPGDVTRKPPALSVAHEHREPRARADEHGVRPIDTRRQHVGREARGPRHEAGAGAAALVAP